MDKENCAVVTDFILLGFSDAPEPPWIPLPAVSFHLGVTVWGNLGMIGLIQVSSGLHTPMYFFLSHLSFVDFSYSTTVMPKMLANILNEDSHFLPGMHCAILPVLHIWGNWGHSAGSDALWPLCGHLWPTAVHGHHVPKSLHGVGDLCYLNATVCSVIHLCLALQIPSYRSNVINHFFCDLPPLFSLACSDVTVIQLMLYIVAIFSEIITSVIILISYLFILITILRMHSAQGRCKAFSTCASHLAAIAVLQGTILSIYCQPHSGKSRGIGWMATVFYTVVIPMLNPLIYSLRNKDVKEALRKVVSSKIFS